MVLTGEGGDELFAGYARYVGERFAPMFQRVPGGVRSALLKMTSHLPGMRRAKVGLYAMHQENEVERITNWFPLFNRDQKAQLLSDGFRQQAGGVSADQIFAARLAKTDAKDTLSRMLYVDTKLWLPDDLLARGDKTSMAASLEARVPLLDHKLVEFAATVPPDLKVKGLTRKYLLKKVSAKLLPTEIIERKKQGFPIPIAHWFRNEARSFVHDLLADETVKRRGLFNPEYVARLLNDHDSGFADHSFLIWGLLNVELWYRAYMDRAPQNYFAYVGSPASAIIT
jgi:asparagine synthase (glutamine-hydrolysing)